MNSVTERVANSSLESLRQLARRVNKKEVSAGRIERQSRAGNRFPLSFGQERFWFLDRLFPGSSAYNIPFALHFSVPVVGGAPPSLEFVTRLMRGILDGLVKRHEIWRTSFTLHNGAPVQVINPAEPVPLEIVLLAGLPEQDKTQAAMRVILDRTSTPFDLSGPSQCRFGMIQLSSTEYVSFIVCHHIVFDGSSLHVAMEDFRSGFLSALGGFHPRAADLPIQYADYALWQREWWKNAEVRNRLNRFWSERLKDLPVLNLPTDHPRPPTQSFRGQTEFFVLGTEHSNALRQLSKDQGVTLFATLLAAWVVLLQRYTGETDIPICVPVSSRTRTETEPLIGFFVNTLVLRLDLSGDPTFSDLQKRIWQTCTESYAHQEMPFEQLVQLLRPVRDMSRNPLSSISFQLQDVPRGGGGADASEFGAGMRLQPFDVGAESSVFDLDFSLSGQWASQWMDRAQDEIRGKLTYSVDLFDAATVHRICDHYQNLLRSVTASPNLHLSQLTMMSPEERQHLLVEWNPAPVGGNLPFAHELFEEQVRQAPHAIALQLEDQQLSYTELNGRANQLARSLRAMGVGPETRVALCLERSAAMVVAMLAVLKAGGAYIPLDPASPPNRLRFMLHDSAPLALLTQPHLKALFEGLNGLPIFDPAEMIQSHEGDSNLNSEALVLRPGNLAYVIYTSGSTGVPKGVEVTQGALSNFLSSMRQEPGLSREDVLLAVTTISFDIAGLELFLPLSVGARVVLAGRNDAADASALADSIARNGVTVMQATPATWHLLLAAGWKGARNLRILCGGDSLRRSLAEELLERSACLWNLFGPTETTIWSTAHRVTHGKGSVPIGRPIANTTLYVLDAALEPAGIGVPAELYIGGAGLARGYYGRPDLTAEHFIPDPFATQPGMRLYRTGDLVRYLADGALEFLGRNDLQVKVRGFRIELAEIESAMLQHPGVDQAAVVAWHRGEGDTRLVAYVQTGSRVDPRELRESLRQKLPEYMVPARFVDVDRMPLNANGKLDRKKLSSPGEAPLAEGERVTVGRTPTETALIEIWSRILNVSDPALDDSFFDLGGHSLLAVRLLEQMQQSFRMQIPLSTLFSSPTIAGLAEEIDSHLAGEMEQATQTTPDFDLEAQLDPAIVPVLATPLASAFSNVLLTGATGFVGAYMLAELLNRTNAIVHCLVRAASSQQGLARLQQRMANLDLWQPPLAGRIKVVCGDLALPRLGLSAMQYDEIAEDSDAIFHAGASVSFFYPYRMLKPANVLGTEEILRLACHRKQKPVHFVSTMGVFSQASLFMTEGDFDPVMKEEDFPRSHGLTMGYTQSKWVADRMVANAIAKGVPAATYRPTMVYGHAATGDGNSQDFLHRFIHTCGQLGYAPDIDWDLNLVPVDFVARAIVQIALHPGSTGRVFHLANGHAATMKDVVDCILSGPLSIQKTSYTAWRKTLLEAPDNALAALARGFPAEDPHVLGNGKVYADRQFRCDNTLQILGSGADSCPDVRGEILQRYVDKVLAAVPRSSPVLVEV
jgi:myxalamid-type nonribosomal peptide synthetase MxaA